MDNNKKSDKFKKEEEFLMNNFIGTAASSGDCTGLVPSGSVDSSDEFNTYKDIYPYCVPIKTNKKERDEK